MIVFKIVQIKTAEMPDFTIRPRIYFEMTRQSIRNALPLLILIVTLNICHAATSVLVCDTGNNAVRAYSVTGTNWTSTGVFASGTYGGQTLTAPLGVAQDAAGVIYIAESAAPGRVLRFDTNAVYLGSIGTNGVQFAGGNAQALTIGPDGNLYLSLAFGTTTANCIYRYNLSAKTWGVFVPNSGTGYALTDPRGLAFASDGNLYVADRNNNVIREFNGTGGAFIKNLAISAPTSGAYPQGLSWDAANNRLLATMTTSSSVYAYTLSGTGTLLYTSSEYSLGVQPIEGQIAFTRYTSGRVDLVQTPTSSLSVVTALKNPGDLHAITLGPRTAVSPPFPAATPDLNLVPGTVINYSPASTGVYLGSPSIVIWTNGDYIASDDNFGSVSMVFKSIDRGATWQQIASLSGQDWSTLFTNNGALYLMGSSGSTGGGYGSVVIRRSTDQGVTWTTPTNSASGLILAAGSAGNDYCTGPTPVLNYNGRFWRAMEHRVGPSSGWAPYFQAFMMSSPTNADLLNATNWTSSSQIAGNSTWLTNNFGGWLEGNAVIGRNGQVFDMLRVASLNYPETVAIVPISTDGVTASFDPTNDFISFPGGSTKFTIRYDPQSDLYWTLAAWVQPFDQAAAGPGSVRNTLALTSSPDLTNWTVCSIVLYHPDTVYHGFQYVDWQFDGNDLIAAVRTAYDDGLGGANSYHNSNFTTFLRVPNFRTLTLTNSYVYSATTNETANFEVTGSMWQISRLDNGDNAFLNRTYTWANVPATLQCWRVTQTWGGLPSVINVRAKQAATLQIASADNPGGDWTPVAGESFNYSASPPNTLQVYQRSFAAGETMTIPQSGFAGRLVLLPDRFGLLAQWKFEETNGLDAWDSANHFNGFRSTTGTVTVPNGVSGQALQVDRLQGGYAKFNNVLNLADGDFSLAMWIRMNTNDVTVGQVPLGKSLGGITNGWFVGANVTAGLGAAGKAVFFAGNPAAPVSQTNVNDGRWHLLMAVYQAGGNAAIYVDGAPVQATAPAALILTSAAQLVLGGWDNGATATPTFTGWIDEVQIYDRALSDVEIERLFNNPGTVAANDSSQSAGIASQISVSNNAATLAWNSIPGWPYTIYRKTNLLDSTWQPVGSFTTLSNASLFTDPNQLPTAFYYLNTP
jgi:hypothetical protein